MIAWGESGQSCPNPDHKRFRGVMFALHGCLACQCEREAADKQRAVEALRALYDEQNGPPLLSRKEAWRAVMQEAQEVLEELEEGP